MIKIGSPLYILREECTNDLMVVIEKLAEIGYDGIEFLGFFGHNPSDIKKKLDSHGIKAVGNHVPFTDFLNRVQKVIDEHKEIGCKYITIAPPGPEGFPNGADYGRTLETYIEIGEIMNMNNMKLLYHNHAEELRSITNGKAALEHIFDDTPLDILYCELDLGWIGIGGGDPEYYLNKYGTRCPVVHFKDYILNNSEDGFKFRPTGYDIMNNADLFEISKKYDPDWYIMDHDNAYGRDIFFDLEISLNYFRNLAKVSY
jgi:sugar phosphate isomerase/epimerase